MEVKANSGTGGKGDEFHYMRIYLPSRLCNAEWTEKVNGKVHVGENGGCKVSGWRWRESGSRNYREKGRLICSFTFHSSAMACYESKKYFQFCIINNLISVAHFGEWFIFPGC